MDNHLNFKKHVEYINGKIAKKVNLLYKLRKVLSKEGKILLFKLIVMPHLRYCSTILTMVNKQEISKLQRNFNKGMRAVLNKRKSENTSNMLRELGYLRVEREVNRDVLTFIYRLENKLLPQYLEDLIKKNKDVYQYSTRQADHFHVKKVSSSKGLKSVFYRGLSLFNELPEEIRLSGPIGSFREKVGTWLASEDYEVIQV